MSWKASAVDVTAVPEPHYQNAYFAIVDFSNNSIVADAVLPELPQFIAFEGCAESARIVCGDYPIAQKCGDPPSDRGIKLTELLRCTICEFNPPRQTRAPNPRVPLRLRGPRRHV